MPLNNLIFLGVFEKNKIEVGVAASLRKPSGKMITRWLIVEVFFYSFIVVKMLPSLQNYLSLALRVVRSDKDSKMINWTHSDETCHI